MPRLFHEGKEIQKLAYKGNLVTRIFSEGRVAYDAEDIDKVKDAPEIIEIIREVGYEE